MGLNNVMNARAKKAKNASAPSKALETAENNHHQATLKANHIIAQNAYKVKVTNAEHAFALCKGRNEVAELKAQLTSATPAILEDCFKICTDFNSKTDAFNSANGFVGDMAFAHADCH